MCLFIIIRRKPHVGTHALSYTSRTVYRKLYATSGNHSHVRAGATNFVKDGRIKFTYIASCSSASESYVIQYMTVLSSGAKLPRPNAGKDDAAILTMRYSEIVNMEGMVDSVGDCHTAEQKDDTSRSAWTLCCHFALFMLMGSGANFVLPMAIVEEIPYFQNVLPEKICIATYMNLANGLGLLGMLAYLYITTYIRNIPYSVSVPFMLITSTLTSFLVAGVYPITLGKVSLLLYICCFIGGGVGAMSSVILNPFMTAYSNDCISAVRVGGSGFILLCGFIAAGQRPGTSHQAFSASIYLIIFGVLLAFALPAYYYIIHFNIGRRGEQINDNIVVPFRPSPRSSISSMDSQPCININPIVNASTTVHDLVNKTMMTLDLNASEKEFASLETIDCASVDATSLIGIDTQPVMDYIAKRLVSDAYDDKYPWLRRTLPYMLTVGWVNFNTWGILSAMIPFAVANAYDSNGSGNLGIALQVGAVLLVLGDLSTTVLKLNLLKGTIVFTILCLVIYIAAMNAKGFHSAASGPIVIVLFSIVRFIESHLVTTSLRAVATDFPLAHRELASRAVGISNQVCTTLGAILSTAVVSLLFSCNGG